MKKNLTLVLVLASVLLLVACGAAYDGTEPIHGTPKNAIYDAPDEFYLDWDIVSIRDNSVVKENHYSMPVYKFETYEELLHLKEIVGMDEIGAEINNADYCPLCDTSEPCDHDKYNEKFFEKFTLLIGWHQYSGVVIAQHDKVDDKNNPQVEDDDTSIVAKYKLDNNGNLVVYLQGERTDSTEAQQWVFVAVPKNKMANCDSVAFLVELPQE